jgi:hydrogenase nickel incorporation protein HypB
MCTTCGCDAGTAVTIQRVDGNMEHHHDHHHDHPHTHSHVHEHTHAHDHEHVHEHHHDHDHAHPHTHTHDHDHGHHHHEHPHVHDHVHEHAAKGHSIQLEVDVLAFNNKLAERNRGFFEAKQICAINLVSSPGSGKTTLLEKTLVDLQQQVACAVIEGDQQTLQDAKRIAATGAPVVQINTGQGCHLDADMIHNALKELKPKDNSLLFIENVGNLVCPAMFDLGEQVRVVIASVTEGDDKPLKYPDMFHSSQLCIINKTDLLPYVPFSIEAFKANASKVNHHLQFIEISALKNEGLEQWHHWLQHQLSHVATG